MEEDEILENVQMGLGRYEEILVEIGALKEPHIHGGDFDMIEVGFEIEQGEDTDDDGNHEV